GADQGSRWGPRGPPRSPMTVMVRSACAWVKTNARRWGSGRHAASTRTPSDVSSRWARWPSSSSPNAVRNRQLPASRASCTAATAPPPPGSSHESRACTISPGSGTRSTCANSIHSTCPTTATFTMRRRSGRRGARVLDAVDSAVRLAGRSRTAEPQEHDDTADGGEHCQRVDPVRQENLERVFSPEDLREDGVAEAIVDHQHGEEREGVQAHAPPPAEGE